MTKRVIIQSDNQIHPQHKSAAAIAVFARNNPKDFQMSNDVFNYYSFCRRFFVELFLLRGQCAAFRFFHRRSRFFVQIRQTLITAIRQTLRFIGQIDFTVLVKRKIVVRSFGETSINNPSVLLTSPNLSFYRVPFLFSRIVSLLFFFRTFDLGFGNLNHHDFDVRREIRFALGG